MSIRDSISEAMDSVAEADETQNYDETPQEVEYATEETSETQASEEEGTQSVDGDNVSGGENEDGTGDPAASENEDGTGDPAASDSGTDKPETVAAKPNGDSIKAPIDWGPQDREAWSKIPRHLQEKVMSREKELNTMLQTTADARKSHEQLGELSSRYGNALSGAGLGNNALEVADRLFSTVSNLRMGSPIQKAQIIADMITSFGVDINTLDSAIVGTAPPAAMQHNDQLEKMISQRLAPFEAHMGQQNALKQQEVKQQQESAISEVQAFGENAEFLGDVRFDMADMIDAAAKRGQTMSMEDAYSKACMINPQIQAVISQREKHAALTSNSDTMASKRLASSSITGKRVGNGQGGRAGSLRDTIESAWAGQGKI